MLNATKKKKLCLKCQACCKILAVPIHAPSERAMQFYVVRGCAIKKIGGVLKLIVPSACLQLTKDGCKIYAMRPEDCREYDGRKDPLVEDICLWKGENQGKLKKQ